MSRRRKAIIFLLVNFVVYVIIINAIFVGMAAGLTIAFWDMVWINAYLSNGYYLIVLRVSLIVALLLTIFGVWLFESP